MVDAVTVRDLVVDRGGRRVLHGLSTAVPPGQVTGLLGPSGSGKTTLMRAIVGVQKVRSGEVTVLGEPAGSAVTTSWRSWCRTRCPSPAASAIVPGRSGAASVTAVTGSAVRRANQRASPCAKSASMCCTTTTAAVAPPTTAAPVAPEPGGNPAPPPTTTTPRAPNVPINAALAPVPNDPTPRTTSTTISLEVAGAQEG